MVVVAAALSGCVPVDTAPASTGTTPATATPTPTATAAALTAPPQVFSGDCGVVLTDEDASRVVAAQIGVSDTPVMGTGPAPFRSAVEQLGGLSCVWGDNSADASADGALINAVVLTETSVPNLDDSGPSCYGVGSGATSRPSCSLTTRASGYVLSAVLSTKSGTAEKNATAAAERLIATFAERVATAVPAPALASAESDAWSGSDCVTIDAAAGIAGVLQSPGLSVADGDGQAEAPPGYYAALDATGYVTCIWQQAAFPAPAGEVQGFSVYLLPGAAWNAADVAALDDAKAIDIEGVESAYLLTVDGVESLQVFDGVNWLMLQDNYADESLDALYPAAAAIVGALNSAG